MRKKLCVTAWLLACCVLFNACSVVSITVKQTGETSSEITSETAVEEGEQGYVPTEQTQESNDRGTNEGTSTSEGTIAAKETDVVESMSIALVKQESRQPWDVQDEWTAQCLMLVCDYLFERGEADTLDPALAEKYNFGTNAATGESYVDITLRSGILFHDGSLLDSADVVYTVNKLKTVQNYYSETVAAIKKVEAVSAQVVRFTMDECGIAALMELNFPIVPSSSVAAALPSGTGPYRLSDVVGNRELTLTANDTYFGGCPSIRTIRVLLVNDEATVRNCFDTGRISLYETDQLEWGRYTNQNSTTVHNTLSDEVVYLEFQSGSLFAASFSNRQKVAYGIDAAAVLQSAYYGRGIVTETLVKPGTWYKEEATKQYGYSQETAESMDVSGSISIKLGYDMDDPVLQSAAKTIQTELQQIGLEVTLVSADSVCDLLLKRERLTLMDSELKAGLSLGFRAGKTENSVKEAAYQADQTMIKDLQVYGLFYMQGGSITGYGIYGELTPWDDHMFDGIENLTGEKKE